MSDMFETLYSSPSGVGLSVPQVGVLLRLVVIDVKRGAKKLLILNKCLDNETVQSKEINMSASNVFGMVARHTSILCTYKDINGATKTIEAKGFLVNVLQHEIDHLDGILYVDEIPGDRNGLNEYLGYSHNLIALAMNKSECKGE